MNTEESQEDLIKITQDCFNNISSLLQDRLIEKNEATLKKKLDWLLNHVSTHPEYLDEIAATRTTLVQVEKEIEMNSPAIICEKSSKLLARI